MVHCDKRKTCECRHDCGAVQPHQKIGCEKCLFDTDAKCVPVDGDQNYTKQKGESLGGGNYIAFENCKDGEE